MGGLAPFTTSVYEPWGDLRREIDNLFDAVLTGARPLASAPAMQWVPPMDVEEKDGHIQLSVEVPGVNPDDLNVNVENGVLTISGEKKFAKETGEERGARSFERRYGWFERSVTLPTTVDANKVTAQYANGVLTLELPRSVESQRRKIDVGRAPEPKKVELADKTTRKTA